MTSFHPKTFYFAFLFHIFISFFLTVAFWHSLWQISYVVLFCFCHSLFCACVRPFAQLVFCWGFSTQHRCLTQNAHAGPSMCHEFYLNQIGRSLYQQANAYFVFVFLIFFFYFEVERAGKYGRRKLGSSFLCVEVTNYTAADLMVLKVFYDECKSIWK